MSRARLSIITPIIFNGYVNWVYPWRLVFGEQFFMLGDHGGFCPVQFEVSDDPV